MMETVIPQACFLLVVVLSVCSAACPYGCSSCSDGRLQCPGSGLTALPKPMPEDTLTIDLTQNNIDSLNGLPNLPEVQSFRMSLNKLRVIRGGDFDPTPSLVSLDLSMNSISKVYKHGFRGLDNLKTISLNGNNIKDIGLIFGNTPALNSLRLGNNEIETIEEENFEKNTMIKMLDLSNNKLTSIHGNAFKNMDMLRYLIVSNNPISTLSDLTFSSTMLSLADLSNCKLESVPRTMPPSLTDFRLGNNMISSVHVEDFKNITRLNLLTLNDNKISFIEHRSFENLKNLKELWLSRNDMVYIPRGLPQGLRKLFIDNNQVVELEPMLFKEGSELKVLSLERNKVRKVHQDSLKYTNKLEKLNLQGNEISLIDVGTFTHLPHLQMLTLTNNPIQVFEKGAFAGLGNLTDLSMSYIEHRNTGNNNKLLQENFLTTMPNLTSIDLMSSIQLTKAFLDIFTESGVETLDNVKKINLQYNELTTLPDVIQSIFPNVKQVLLDGNLLQCDRKLLWLRAWMQTTTSVSFHQYEQPACNAPEAVRGRLLSELSQGDFRDIPEQSNDLSERIQDPESERAQSQPRLEASDASKSSSDVYNPNPNVQNPVPARQSSTSAGVRVVIKPPKGQQAKPSGNVDNGRSTKLSKAERKAARKAARERKQREKEERKRQRKLKKNADDAKRKKRRIHSKKAMRCKVDKDGKQKCVRRKRCTVDKDGNVKCRKRKGKKERKLKGKTD